MRSISVAFLGVIWLCLVAALFLPFYSGAELLGSMRGAGIPGWQVMVYSLLEVVIRPWLVILQPLFLLQIFYPFGCLLVLMAPLKSLSLEEDSWLLCFPLLGFIGSVWFWPSEIHSKVMYGGWSWIVSVLLLAAAVVFHSIAVRLDESKLREALDQVTHFSNE